MKKYTVVLNRPLYMTDGEPGVPYTALVEAEDAQDAVRKATLEASTVDNINLEEGYCTSNDYTLVVAFKGYVEPCLFGPDS